jgi:arylsulfatase A-like enzyme
MSGFLPHETKVFESNTLPTGIQTLAEILKDHGYKTVAVVSNYMLRKKRGYEQGFMIYDDTMDDHELVRKWPERIAERTTDRAIELLKQYHKEQLFIWIHYQDPHGPYTPPDDFTEQFLDKNKSQKILELNYNTLSGQGGIPAYQIQYGIRNFYYYQSRYDGEILYMDQNLEPLFTVLKELGLYEKALIIFSADHGEGLGEHDYFFAHGENLYNHQTHVPLIIKYGKNTKGRRSDYVQHIDIVPTVLNLLHIKEDSHLRGRNFLKNPNTESEILAAMHSPLNDDGYKFSLVVDGFKFIYTPKIKGYELYDLTKDPHETKNLSEDTNYSDKLRKLMIRYNSIVGEDFLKLRVKRKPTQLSKEEIEKMKSLGYVQ